MSFKDSRILERKLLSFIKRFSSKPAPEVDFDRLAADVFRFQFERNAFYRRFCEMEGRTPERVRGWKEIPAMPTLAFKELVLTSFPAKEKIRVFRTSGTTVVGRGAHYFRTLKLYEASILPPFKKYLLEDGAKLSYYFLIHPPQDAPDSSLSYMMGVVNRRFAKGRGRFYAKNGALRSEALLNDLKKERGKAVLLATAFSLKGFLDHLKEKRVCLRLAPGSRLMETGGFKGKAREISKAALYRQCGERLGIPVTRCVSEYGMTELSSQMYGRLFWKGMRGPAWLRTQVIDPKTGKECRRGRTGVLKHVDLANLGSVAAVQTEDLGRAAGESFELLGRALNSELRGCSLTYEEFIRSSG